MRRLGLAVSLLLSLTVLAEGRRRSVQFPTTGVVPRIEAVAAQALIKVPGVEIAVRRANFFYLNGFGEFDRDTHEPVTPATVFQIASVSKQFTGAAIAKLEEQGRLSAGDSVRRFIPELDGRFEPITLRHLLQHTSGVADHLGQIDTPYDRKTQQEVLALIMARPPSAAPGVAYGYSNAGYYLLGMVIERASNMTYEQYLRTTFFEPLQMTATSYCGTRGNLPVGYGSDPRTGEFFEYEPMNVDLLFAAGALCSTATDLLRWNDALTSGHAVSPESYAKMTDGYAAYIGAEYGYGLVVDRFLSRPRVWHNGMIPGFQSHVAHFPDDDLTIVVLINWYALRDRASDVGEELAKVMLQSR